MYRADKTDTNETIYAYEKEKEDLKQYCKDGIIVCPECGKLLNVRSGSKKQHFYHLNNNCSYKYHEPETEEHEAGKLLLRDRLVELYPYANVEIEKRITATNQRSDVLVIHDDNSIWAFEFQCSPITYDTWIERHNLYDEAGILDFWILGESLHSYGISNKKVDKTKHRLSGLEKAIWTNQKRIHYMDVTSGKMRILGQDKYELSKTILKCRELNNKLQNLTIKNNTWWNSEDAWKEKKQKERDHEEKYKTDPVYRAEHDKMTRDKYLKPFDELIKEVFPDSYIVDSSKIKIIVDDE